MQEGQIIKIHSDFYYVNSTDGIFECKLREVIKKQKQKVYVGDYVEFSSGAIESILPRENFIARPSVANIDQIIIISAVKEPELNYMQLDRYIAFAKYHDIKTVLCFNKNDLSDNDKTIEKVFEIYEPLGFDILFTSAKEGYGLDEFKKILEGKISVLAGSSGVGKSSLINAICNVNIKTKTVSDKTGRGTHTTRHCEIININECTGIVDTPGFSNLKFDFLMPYDVDKLFPEIYAYKEFCKFPDCIHIHETDCAVKQHLGVISQSRYESYVSFAEEAQEYKNKVKTSGTKIESSHKQNRNKISVKISSAKRTSARNTLKQNMYKDI
ncbi:ribosome small subunit-dependent GTPase A [bacterium]|nr:ribosome small subunit-dependent GTPase A [bacterium]